VHVRIPRTASAKLPGDNMPFNDHFSDAADNYQAYRPKYPNALFDYLASLAPTKDLAWDCATGNGQAALGLTPHFQAIVATDASPQQIAKAHPDPKVGYVIALAERTPLPDDSIDPVTVASAAHWLDHNRFFAEVRRVVRPVGVLACWTYHLQTVSPEVDAVVQRLYAEVLGPYWTPAVRFMEDGYRSLPFPFDEIVPPSFKLVQKWDLDQLAAFMGTWSGSCRYRKATGQEPLYEIGDELAAAWGNPDEQRDVTWDLHLRVGKVAG
jgi:ubiquinone/menaquinone biosynthesis C-methylase UbiE